MNKNNFSPLRSKETIKPKVVCPEVIFYFCIKCKSIIQYTLPQSKMHISCCNEFMHKLEAKEIKEVITNICIDYKIIGGYNKNAVEVFWKEKDKDALVKWVYLKTFTGGQMKYVTNKNKKLFVFALADEDAYVYCDEDPCIECTFRCKRGFEIYVYVQKIGLIKIPIDRMHSNWQSS